jgi:hypothetical protein
VSGVTYEDMAALVDNLALEMDDPHGHASTHHDSSSSALRNQQNEPEVESEEPESEELEPEPELESQSFPVEPIFFHEDTSLPPPVSIAELLPELEFLQPLPAASLDETMTGAPIPASSGPETESVDAEAPEASVVPVTKDGAKGQGRRERHRGDRGRRSGSEAKKSKDETHQDQRQRRPPKGPREDQSKVVAVDGGPQTIIDKKSVEQQQRKQERETRPRPASKPQQPKTASSTQREDGVVVGVLPVPPSRAPRSSSKPVATSESTTSSATPPTTSRPQSNKGQTQTQTQSSGQGRREKKEFTPKAVPVPVA